MEYNYPKITTIAFRDFRSLGDIQIDLTKSPLVYLKGRSEVGKSSITYGVRLLGSNAEQRKHKGYIRDGAQAWKILVKFEDGRVLIRSKSTTGQQFQIYAPDPNNGGRLKLQWSADKLDENAIPKEAQELVGFCIEPETKELLNIRMYKQLLLFVDTSSSTNYKVVYNALRMESLYKAVQIGTKEANAVNAERASLETKINTCQEQLRKIVLVDTEPLLKVKKALEARLDSYEKVEDIRIRLAELHKIATMSQAMKELSQLGNANEGLVDILNRANSLRSEFISISTQTGTLQEVQKLEIANTQALELFEALSREYTEYTSLDTGAVQLLGNVQQISEEQESLLEVLNTAYQKLNEYTTLNQTIDKEVLQAQVVNEEEIALLTQGYKLISDYRDVDKLYKEHHAKAEELHKLLHTSGVLFGTCPSCGETVIIENQ